MKSIILTLLFAAGICMLLASCSDNSGKSSTSGADTLVTSVDSLNLASTASCAGCANVYVDGSTAKSMMMAFGNEYVRTLQTKERIFDTTAFLETKVIKEFYDTLMKGSRGFDGVRLYYGATDGLQSKSVFVLVPTEPRQDHPNVWGKTVNVTSSKFGNFNLEAGVAKKLIEKYRKYFKEQTDLADETTAVHKGLTSGAWVNECVFEIMHNFLVGSPGFTGFRIYAAAYPTEPQNRPVGYGYDKQSTILFVPVDADGKDNWDTLKPNKNLPKSQSFPKAWANALNHSELCPKNCPTPEY